MAGGLIMKSECVRKPLARAMLRATRHKISAAYEPNYIRQNDTRRRFK